MTDIIHIYNPSNRCRRKGICVTWSVHIHLSGSKGLHLQEHHLIPSLAPFSNCSSYTSWSHVDRCSEKGSGTTWTKPQTNRNETRIHPDALWPRPKKNTSHSTRDGHHGPNCSWQMKGLWISTALAFVETSGPGTTWLVQFQRYTAMHRFVGFCRLWTLCGHWRW